MISRSDWEPLPTPTLSPFARGYLSLCRFFTAAVWCVPALRVPLVHSLINHFRQVIPFSPRMDRALKASIEARARATFITANCHADMPLSSLAPSAPLIPTQQATPGSTRPPLPDASTCTTLAHDPSTGQIPDRTKRAPRVCSPVVTHPR